MTEYLILHYYMLRKDIHSTKLVIWHIYLLEREDRWLQCMFCNVELLQTWNFTAVKI